MQILICILSFLNPFTFSETVDAYIETEILKLNPERLIYSGPSICVTARSRVQCCVLSAYCTFFTFFIEIKTLYS